MLDKTAISLSLDIFDSQYIYNRHKPKTDMSV